MHFCFLIQGFLIGNRGNNIVGPHVQTYLTAKGLLSKGYKVSYISLTNDEDYIGKQKDVEGITVYFLGSKTLPYRIEELLSFRKVYKLLKKINPDIIYTRGRSSLPYITGLYANRYGKKSMWTGARDRDFNRFEYVREKVSEQSLFLKPLSYLLNYLTMVVLFEKGIKSSSILFVQNNHQIESIKNLGKFEDVNILPQISPGTEKKKSRNEKVVVLWAAGLKKEKQPEVFIDIARKINDGRFVFKMIGPVLDNDYEDLLKDSESLINFEYLGPKNYFDTLEEFKKCDILMNTSVNEGFPNTIVQAWSYGAMVLTLGVNPNELLNGFLGYSCSSADEIIEKLKYIADNNLVAENEDKIIDYVKNNHLIENVISKIIKRFK